MKTILCALVALILLVSPRSVQAQQVSGFVEYEHIVLPKLHGTQSVPEINVYLRGPIKDKLGWTVWTLTTQFWSEALFGLTYAPVSWMEVSASVGRETGEYPERYSGSLWLGKGRFALLSIIEDGGSGEWYKNVATYSATKSLLVGVFNQDGVGTGPYVEVKLKKFTTWGTVVGKKSGALGVKYNF